MSKPYIAPVILVVVLTIMAHDMEFIDARKTCTTGIGVCGNNCDSLCKQRMPGSEGFCNTDTQIPFCFCSYPCGPPDPPPTCRGGVGVCDGRCGNKCCSAKCASRYPGGTGGCELAAGISGCYCYYPCKK